MEWSVVGRSEGRRSSDIVRLQGVGLVSNIDRYVSAPLLVMLSHRFHASLSAAAVVASGHLLAYGMSQLPWTAVLARRGPAFTMRVALGGAGLSAIMAALAPNLGLLLAARVAGGALLGAAVPAALLYIGTSVTPAQRPYGFGAIVSANGLGIVLAVAIAVFATATGLWWVAYLSSGAALIGCAFAVLRLRDDMGPPWLRPPTRLHEPFDPGQRPRVLPVMRPMALVLVEGAVVVGAVVILPALADRSGHDREIAAAMVAVYGVAMPLTGLLLRRWSLPFAVSTRAPWAGAVLCLLPLPILTCPPLLGLALDAVLLGTAWSLLHPVLQAAATSVWQEKAPAVLGLFVSALFVGGALGSQLLAAVASDHGALTVFMICSGGGLILACIERVTRPTQA